ncbi:GNAT family N-acetyltransferase [Candidatus Uabimicrobium amorphum]|uniref:Ribosomal-protein-serine acetyltransferase n=1 Tax=Uabimicrobium amorphum TaxID=2596890 RepID=A0A5S9F1W3_UABAM|nr:GNAT family N-acetyltransferase [Candidatus Uabimicrobium amorphum]BBM82832.1 ribosomal-protein-serine acetyltransferase [Candidatus Uabimicrobium amorphum]
MRITPNILLENLTIEDASTLFSLIEKNRDLLEKYLYWVKSVVDVKTAEDYIRTRVSSDKPGAKWFKIIFRKKISGIFGIKSLCHEKSEVEIGYWLSQHAHGNGIVTQIISTVCESLKHKKNIKYLKICCLEENHASISVAKSVGGIHTNTIHKYFEIDGILQDLHVYTAKLF